MAELDDAYSVGAYIPDADDYYVRWAQAADAFRAELGPRAMLDIAYGDSARQVFDLFHPEGVPKGLMIFVHGGFWLKLDKSSWSHLAAGAVARGWSCAMPSYDLCPAVGIPDITRQIVRAVTAIAKEAAGPITLAGHSAGGHLVARTLAPGMLGPGVAERVARVVPISPLADLRPLLLTSMNAQFGLDMDTAEAESPALQPVPQVPVSVWVGAEERPAFLDQARVLAQAWGAEHVEVAGRHHFDVIEALEDPGSDLVARLTP